MLNLHALRFSIFILVTVVDVLGATFAIAQSGPATVVVSPVISRVVAPTQQFVANVKANRSSVVGSAVDGRVLEYLINAGESVESGQPLAQLRTGTIELEIAAAEAELQLRNAELEALQNGSLPEEIALAEASVQAAKAATELAKSRMERAQKLFKNSSGFSLDEFEQARSFALQAAATLIETENRAELVRQGPRRELIAQAIARVGVQEGLIAVLRDRMEKYTVRSPFKGFVSAELTEAGAWVKSGDAVASVVEIDPVEIEVFVPEAKVRFVEIGSACPIEIESIPGSAFQGRVEQIVPMADSRARTFPVKVAVPNPLVNGKHPLMPGMLARATLPTAMSQQRLLVDKDALQVGGATPVVFKVVKNIAVVVPVKAGPAVEGWISVEPTTSEPLTVDDLVVSRGNARLRPGQEVVIESQQPAPDF